MMWRQLSLVLALSVGATACDSLPFFGGKDAPDSTATVADSAPAPAPAVAVTPPPAQPVRSAATVRRVDAPWTPTDTGTVDPGMTREQVIAVWGVPEVERVAAPRAYLYFRNGCEVSCGTFDVVFLEHGVVVDAITRGPGHTYSGVSSSPMGRTPSPTMGGAAPMAVPVDSTSAETPE